MKNSIDSSTRVVVNKDTAELLEIRHKKQINKRLTTLEKEMQVIRREFDIIKGELSFVV